MPNYNWNWAVLFQEPYLGWLVDGLFATVGLAVLGWMIALPLGTLVGVLRSAPGPVARFVGGAYVQVFRNIPLILQIFIWFFVVPELLPTPIGMYIKRGLPYPEFVTVTVGLGLYTASRVAETIRAGIESVGTGIKSAALASGMTLPQAYRHVLLPIAFRIVVPPLTSEFLGIFKNTSVALTIGVLELTMQAHQIESFTFQGFEAFTAATVLYAVISWVCLVAAQRAASRRKIAGMISSESGKS